MMRTSPTRTSWLLVVSFAIAMAWVEAACVYDLRVLVDRLQPYQSNPLPMAGVLGQVELAREAATLVMLIAVGALAGRTPSTRLAYTAIAFGVWDIFYYVFLKAISGWPASPLDWDILFLLPLPWWGPVIAPVSIAVLLIVWGTLASASCDPGRTDGFASRMWALAALGASLALYSFMADSIRAAPHGLDAVRMSVPKAFDWSLFLVALALMAAPVARAAWAALPLHFYKRWATMPFHL